MRKYQWAARPQGSPPTYEPRFIDLIQAMRGRPHRVLEPSTQDWLTRYLGRPHDPAQQAPDGP